MGAPSTGPGARLTALWTRATGSFWAVPAAMCAGAVLLSQVLVLLDRSFGAPWTAGVGVVGLQAGPDGSRDVLSAIAGSMLAVASTTFSTTMAVLTLTTSNYGPRLVRKFMADRANQVVLGTFVGTSLYALLVLRSVRTTGGSGGESFTPHAAVLVAVGLAVVCIGVLIYFVHHISTTVQVSALSRRVRDELRGVVDELYPDSAGDGPSRSRAAPRRPDGADDGDAATLAAGTSGYVTRIAGEALLAEARRHDVLVELRVRPGTYVVDHTALLRVAPAGRTDDQLLEALRACVELGDARTPEQDVESAVQQLTELLDRSLSPGTNDPFTAVTALDDLSGGRVPLLGRPVPAAERLDDDGVVRLVAPAVEPVELLDLVFDVVRAYALTTPVVLLHAVVVAERLDGATRDPEVRRRLREQVGLLVEAYAAQEPPEQDLARLRDRAAPLLLGQTRAS